MRTNFSSLGERGEVVQIWRAGEPYGYLTVMVIGTRLLNPHQDGTIEVINPRADHYKATQESPEAKLKFISLEDARLAKQEEHSFYQRLLRAGEISTKDSVKRVIIKYCRLYEAHAKDKPEVGQEQESTHPTKTGKRIHSDAPHAHPTMAAKGELRPQTSAMVH